MDILANRLTNPNLFQGNLNKKQYFEGWYYKQVSADGKTAISFIPGISLNKDEPHSFVQYIIVQEDEREDTHTGYLRLTKDAFKWQDDPFQVMVGENLFSTKKLSVNIETKTDHISGAIHFGALSPIGTSPLQPNIMGPFAYFPKMECYHGITSMNHSLQGSLLINGKMVDFTGGKGYIEKDWGSKFPKHYVWIQSNHFREEDTSVFFSVAHVPFLGMELQGFISNIHVKGKEYRFATYNNSKLSISFPSENQVNVKIENDQAEVTLIGTVEHLGNLQAPVESGMHKTIKEGVSGNLQMELWDKETDYYYQGLGTMAGIEIVDAHEMKSTM